MKSLPISQAVANQVLQNIGFVATDMDGTLTQQGKFTAVLLQALEDLAAAGVRVTIVTGRSAGWVSGLASYLPVMGAIAENGGIFYSNTGHPVLLTPIADIQRHRQELGISFDRLKAEFPQLRETSDNRYRITDWTFDIEGLTPEDLDKLGSLCENMGWGFTYSSVQCHIKPKAQDKAIAVLQLMGDYFPDYKPTQMLTVGDSPNDESLFDASRFPVSVGVANVLEYSDRLIHMPTYVTTEAEGKGFCELARYILEAVRKGKPK